MASEDVDNAGSSDEPASTFGPSNRDGSRGQRGDVTRILSAIEDGDGHAAEKLPPLIYDELRKLAAAKMAQEKPGQTLQATVLVHDAYIRLVDVDKAQHWNSRGHFFGAAAEAMRRILVENARKKGREKRGGDLERCDLDEIDIATPTRPAETVAINEALEELQARNELAANLVTLRYFGGFSNDEVAQILRVSPRKASEIWTYARTWLLAEISQELDI